LVIEVSGACRLKFGDSAPGPEIQTVIETGCGTIRSMQTFDELVFVRSVPGFN
jgi:hypothetical protein